MTTPLESTPNSNLSHIREGRGLPEFKSCLSTASTCAIDYLTAVTDIPNTRKTGPSTTTLTAFTEPFPESSTEGSEVISFLHQNGSAATSAHSAPTYFGFVCGGTLPVCAGASWLMSAWDQNAALQSMSPIASCLHIVVRGWLLDALHLPPTCEISFVSSATTAAVTALAVARDQQLKFHCNYDAQNEGLSGSPGIHVVLCKKSHSTLFKALGLIGIGRKSKFIHFVEADDQGRMKYDCLPTDIPESAPLILCLQAGEVNTGAFDDFSPLISWAHEKNGWVHVDGAFGLWALTDPDRFGHLTAGLAEADSWLTDGHKFLNMTYDCGIAFVKNKQALSDSFSTRAGYLPPSQGMLAHDSMHFTPQSSQRGRAIEAWAALKGLGRSGLKELIGSNCDRSKEMAAGFESIGLRVLNDVVFNQTMVVVDYDYKKEEGSDLIVSQKNGGMTWTTKMLIAAIQDEGTCWVGPTVWEGIDAMRVSISGWNTRSEDIERVLVAVRMIIVEGERDEK